MFTGIAALSRYFCCGVQVLYYRRTPKRRPVVVVRAGDRGRDLRRCLYRPHFARSRRTMCLVERQGAQSTPTEAFLHFLGGPDSARYSDSTAVGP